MTKTEDEVLELVKITENAISEKKGENIRIIDIHDISYFADYFIIASGSNKKQIQTIADNIEEKLKKAGKEPKGIEGYPEASWILMDYAEFIVHIFSSEERLFYDLERIWKDGKEIEL